MADNVVSNAGSGGATFATDEIAGVHYPRSKLIWGADGTATDASAAAPLPVVQTGALPAGTNAIGKLAANSGVDIGDVDVASLPALPAGTNNIGDVDVLTLPALPAGTNNIGDIDVLSIAAGDNNIGNVDVVTLPALPAGTNNIGDVDVLTLPALPAGTNNIGDVDVLSIAAGDNNIGNVDVVTLPALVAGTANIGDVDVLTLPAIPTGSNTIGNVGLATRTSGGLSVSRLVSGASTNETEAKASAGQVYGVIATNTNAAVRYLKLYDNTAAGTTIGTTTPKMTIPIPGNTAGAGIVFMTDQGIAFGTGITYGTTTGAADADTGAVAASEIIVQVLYA